ncbi:MAG: hypothetical protein LUF87_09635 [Alistipes sp.]|nr:hypothetical protein [Alistipes sp.]
MKKNNNKQQQEKARVLSAVNKMMADKKAWLKCIDERKPLSTLEEKGVVLSKLG